VHGALRACVVSLVRSRRAPPVPLIVLPKSCARAGGDPVLLPHPSSGFVCFLSFFLSLQQKNLASPPVDSPQMVFCFRHIPLSPLPLLLPPLSSPALSLSDFRLTDEGLPPLLRKAKVLDVAQRPHAHLRAVKCCANGDTPPRVALFSGDHPA